MFDKADEGRISLWFYYAWNCFKEVASLNGDSDIKWFQNRYGFEKYISRNMARLLRRKENRRLFYFYYLKLQISHVTDSPFPESKGKLSVNPPLVSSWDIFPWGIHCCPYRPLYWGISRWAAQQIKFNVDNMVDRYGIVYKTNCGQILGEWLTLEEAVTKLSVANKMRHKYK